MIVWGGFDGSSYLNTGGRYNPSTDSWTATSTTNAPDCPRRSHGSVDRQRNDRLGRTVTATLLNTGGRYNPGTDSWTATSTTNAPDARDSHTAVWTGSEMIVWGGTGRKRYPQHWREILRAIRYANAYSNTNCNRNPDCNSHANRDPNSNAYAHAMHRKMYTDTAAAPYAGTAPVACVAGYQIHCTSRFP